MTTIITHAAIPLAIGLGLGSRVIAPRLLLAGVVASMLPDADVAGFHFGVSYGDTLGHRGLTHSLAAAAVVGMLAALAASWLESTRKVAFAFVACCMASHGLLDMLTNGGLGVALLWPASTLRYFFPWHGIAVSPIGVTGIFSARGAHLALSELRWVWLPSLLAMLALRFALSSRNEK